MPGQPVEKLDDYRESLLALATNGGDFATYAVSSLLDSRYTSTRYWMLISCLKRGDKDGVRRFLRDWEAQDRKPKASVSKFTPGEHYHVLGTKFDDLDEAIRYLNRRGYDYGGLVEKHIYKEE